MNEIGEKYLPAGTVVMLKGGSKRLMITGFCSVDPANDAEVYDYSGCMYPEGFITSEQVALFNHDQIEKVYHLGLVDDEEKEFKKALVQALEASNNIGAEETDLASIPAVGPGLPGSSEPAPVAPAPVEAAPVAPAPVEPAPVAPAPVEPAPVAPAPVEAAPEAPAPAAPTLSNIQFDENGTVISA